MGEKMALTVSAKRDRRKVHEYPTTHRFGKKQAHRRIRQANGSQLRCLQMTGRDVA